MHYMKWIYPRRLRNQMILMAILMVIVPTLTIGYIVETEGRSAVLSEKEKKLSAVVNLLNQALGNRYDLYIDLPREERIRALNAELAPITENITHAFPGIGAGYYNKTLDAIITYAPSALYQNNVGRYHCRRSPWSRSHAYKYPFGLFRQAGARRYFEFNDSH